MCHRCDTMEAGFSNILRYLRYLRILLFVQYHVWNLFSSDTLQRVRRYELGVVSFMQVYILPSIILHLLWNFSSVFDIIWTMRFQLTLLKPWKSPNFSITFLMLYRCGWSVTDVLLWRCFSLFFRPIRRRLLQRLYLNRWDFFSGYCMIWSLFRVIWLFIFVLIL